MREHLWLDRILARYQREADAANAANKKDGSGGGGSKPSYEEEFSDAPLLSGSDMSRLFSDKPSRFSSRAE